jgi:hypothetical protein
MLDCQNVFYDNGQLCTRYGVETIKKTQKKIDSISNFIDGNGRSYLICKSGRFYFAIDDRGIQMPLWTNGGEGRHEAKTVNGRHIITDSNGPLQLLSSTFVPNTNSFLPVWDKKTTGLAVGTTLSAGTYEFKVSLYSTEYDFECPASSQVSHAASAGDEVRAEFSTLIPDFFQNGKNYPWTETDFMQNRTQEVFDKFRVYVRKDSGSWYRFPPDVISAFGIYVGDDTKDYFAATTLVPSYHYIYIRLFGFDTSGLTPADSPSNISHWPTMTTLTIAGNDEILTPLCTYANAGGTLAAGVYTPYASYYSSKTGYETNAVACQYGTITGTGVITMGYAHNWKDLYKISNKEIDSVRFYLQLGAGSKVFVSEKRITDINALNTRVGETITAFPSSTEVAKESNQKFQWGGARFVELMNEMLVLAGNNDYPHDVWFSSSAGIQYFPSDANILYTPGDGPITAIKTGFFNDSKLDPYLAIFKKNSIHIYSNIDAQGKFVQISDVIGCVSSKTTTVINGDIFFLSESGWYVISNGVLAKDSKQLPIPLGGNGVIDVFRQPGFPRELNRQKMEDFHSVYWDRYRTYLTFVCEGGETIPSKAYPFEFGLPGFKFWKFPIKFTCSCIGREIKGRDQIIYFGTDDGEILKYSPSNRRTDVTNAGESSIPAWSSVGWVQGIQYDASYNFRELVFRTINSPNNITIKAYRDFHESAIFNEDIINSMDGFILDVDKLDIGIFGDDRRVHTLRTDINWCGENLAVIFYQNKKDSNIGLISAELCYSKNGNRNVS